MVADEEYVFVCQGTSSREGSMLVLAESSCEVATSIIEMVGVVVGDKGACSEFQLSLRWLDLFRDTSTSLT
jgi:hypothetical protein